MKLPLYCEKNPSSESYSVLFGVCKLLRVICRSSESVQEKAVIVKQKARKSLMTPDETVTVNFVPQQTNVKKSFPVTHTKLLKEDDLSSPGSAT